MHALDVLGDPVRRRILELLVDDELSAGDIGNVIQGEFVDKVGDQRIFMTLPTAVDAYLDWYVDRHGSTPPGPIRPPR